MTNEYAIAKYGKPLTMEQLRGMDGQPVLVKLIEESKGRKEGWALIYNDEGYCAVQRWTQSPLWYKDYGKTWLAYAYHPVHIDREKWEPCVVCSVRHRYWREYQYEYCPYCGRPLTDQAWDELESQLRGVMA